MPHLNCVHTTGKSGQTSKNIQASEDANYHTIRFSKYHRYLTSPGVNHSESPRTLAAQMGLSSQRLCERSLHKALTLLANMNMIFFCFS